MPRDSEPTDPEPARERLAKLLGGGNVMVLSGAGMSTDSGIPDYRGPNGAMRNRQPMMFKEFRGHADARRRFWARSHAGWSRIAAAQPNVAHRAVAELESAGIVSGVVTQNVDALHDAAGSEVVIDLHGRLDVVVCLDCDDHSPRDELAARLSALNPEFAAAPSAGPIKPDGDVELDPEALSEFRVADCRRCGGVLKPDVVFFGESVPKARVAIAMEILERARVLLVLGSSLTVWSGYRFVRRSAALGTPVAIVNRGPTRGDGEAKLKIDAPLASTLGDLLGRDV